MEGWTDNSAYQQEISNICAVATWEEGKITEWRLFYDLVGVMTQIGTMSSKT
jgi:hypothetical protein